MIIAGIGAVDEISVNEVHDKLFVQQFYESVAIDKHQATRLIAVLQKWVDGGEVE